METKKLILCDTGVFFELFHQNVDVCRELDGLGFEMLSFLRSIEKILPMWKVYVFISPSL